MISTVYFSDDDKNIEATWSCSISWFVKNALQFRFYLTYIAIADTWIMLTLTLVIQVRLAPCILHAKALCYDLAILASKKFLFHLTKATINFKYLLVLNKY